MTIDLAAALAQRARQLGDRGFLTTGDGTLTWRQTDDAVGRLAGAMMERDLGPGARLVTCGGKPQTQILCWLACQRVGAVWVPLNPLLGGRPLDAILIQARPDGIIVDDESPLEGLDIDMLVTTGVPLSTSAVPSSTTSNDAAVTELDRAEAPTPAWAKIMFTSGTTGSPKGVVWSRRCEAVWAKSYAEELLDVDVGDGLYTCLPISHVTGQGTVMAAMLRGASLTVGSRFSPFRFWDEIRAAEARRFTFVGTILSTLAKTKPRPDDRDHGVDRIVGAGAPIASWRAIEDRFGVEIMETWGQTETAGCYTWPPSLPQRPGSIGQPSDRFEIRLDDPAGSELLLRPAQHGAIFEGYLGGGDTLESPFDAEGWYHTGDVMRLGADDHLEFVVRVRESIRRRGEIIASVPIEEAALTHPLVLEAAAIAVPDDDGTDDEIQLCVVLAPSATLDGPELHRYLRDRLPTFMVPRFIALVDRLDKTPSTRIQKFKLHRLPTAWDARHRRRKGSDDHEDDRSQG